MEQTAAGSNKAGLTKLISLILEEDIDADATLKSMGWDFPARTPEQMVAGWQKQRAQAKARFENSVRAIVREEIQKMMREQITPILTDDSEMLDSFREIESILELNGGFCGDLERGELRLLFDDPLDFFEIHDGPAGPAGEFGVSVKRAQRLDDLLSALRALDVNRSGHFVSS